MSDNEETPPMSQMKTLFEIFKSHSQFGYDIRIGMQDAFGDDNGWWAAQPLTVKRLEPCATIPMAMHVDRDALQGLMDALWQTGIRPSEGQGGVGQIGALKAHLDDKQQEVKWLRGQVEKKK